MRVLGYTLGFLGLLFLQEYLFSAINILGIVGFFPYILVLLLLPLSMSRAWLLVLGFVMGWCVDGMGGMAGLNAMCMTWLGFVRPYVVGFTLGRDVSVADVVPLAYRVGPSRFMTYSVVMCLLFAFPYFLLEMMTLVDIWFTLLRALASTVVTVVVVYLLQLPFNKSL